MTGGPLYDGGHMGDGLPLSCPRCGSARSEVITTRDHKGGKRRRRRCQSCKQPYMTMEVVADLNGDLTATGYRGRILA